MRNKATKDVWKFLGVNEKIATEFRLRTMIFEKIKEVIESEKLSARDVEKMLDERQPRVSDLLNGKLEKFSSDKLYGYLIRLTPGMSYKLVGA